MQLTHLLLALPFLSTLTLAKPAPVAPAAATASCHSTTTFSAVFDHLPTGTAVPAGLGGVDWSGFTVSDASSDAELLNPRSPPNWADISYPIGASISQATYPAGGAAYPFEIREFSFGCGFEAEVGSVFPSGCSIEVVTDIPFQEGSVATYGPYTFSGDDNYPYGANMTRVVLEQSAFTFWFVITEGPGVGYAYIDNVVIVNVNTQGACAGS